jgi:hypothetical protein
VVALGCSVALHANSMWTNTIGQAPDAQAGSNAAIEAALNAPMHRGGRKARQQQAASIVAQTGQPLHFEFILGHQESRYDLTHTRIVSYCLKQVR